MAGEGFTLQRLIQMAKLSSWGYSQEQHCRGMEDCPGKRLYTDGNSCKFLHFEG